MMNKDWNPSKIYPSMFYSSFFKSEFNLANLFKFYQNEFL